MQNKEEEREFFDENAEEGWVTFSKRGFEKLTQVFIKDVQPKKSQRVLEIGCGTGEFTHYLHELGLQVTGTDLSQESLRIAKKNVPQATYIVDDIEYSKLKGGFDIVVFSAVLHHFSDPTKALANAYRLLKKGGKLFAFDPHQHSPILFLYRDSRSPFASERLKTSNEKLLSIKGVSGELEKAGFTEINCHGQSHIYFDVKYFKKLFPFPLYYMFILYNIYDFIFWIPPLNKRFGTFLLSSAKK